jgi:hypothetical protein
MGKFGTHHINQKITYQENTMKNFTILVLMFLFSACANRINHPPASQDQLTKAQNFNVDVGTSRTYFFLGKYDGTGTQLNQAMDVYVNEKKIVTLGNKNEFAISDLKPGKYSFKCKDTGSDSNLADYIPLEAEIKSGESLFLACTFFNKSSGTSNLFGAVGAAVQIATQMKLVWTFVEDKSFKQNISNYILIDLD